MPYEIPSEIEYKERIVFGLTFKQMLISLPFLFVILLIFKTDAHMYVKGIISAFVVSLASLLLLAHPLGCLDEFNRLAEPPPANSLAELEREAAFPKRGRK